MKLIDIHTHLQFAQFDADRAAVIGRIQAAELGVINVGTDLETSRQAVQLAEQYPTMWATVGLHPTDTDQAFDVEAFRALAQHPKVVAVGECGLDYFRAPEQKDKQHEIFLIQIALAKELNKPLMLHIRQAYREAYEILKVHDVRANCHFFAGSWPEAQLFLDLGHTLSFAGPITFAADYDEVIKNAPLEQIHAETDAPFAAPAPYRGRRNEPMYVSRIIARIAELKGLPVEAVQAQLLTNAQRVFGLAS